MLTETTTSRRNVERPGAIPASNVSVQRLLFVSVGNPAPSKVVRRQVDGDPIPLQDSDVVLTHLPTDIRQHFVSVLELHPESRIGEHLGDRPHHLYRVASHARCRSPSPVIARGWSQTNAVGIHGVVARRRGAPLDVRRVTTGALTRQRDPLWRQRCGSPPPRPPPPPPPPAPLSPPPAPGPGEPPPPPGGGHPGRARPGP